LQDTDSNESISIRTPPPAYSTDDNSEAVSKKSSDAYSNLMSFLDDASQSMPPPQPRRQRQSSFKSSNHDTPPIQRSQDPPAPVPPLDIEITQHHDDVRDDLSSMSYSMNSSIQESKAFTSNKYIWNDLDDDEGTERHRDHRHDLAGMSGSRMSGGETARSTADTFFRAPPTYRTAASDSSTHSKTSLQSNVEEIKAKASNMQQELRKKNQRMKDLQTELTRLKTVKTRKKTKLSEKYERELEELKINNSKALEKQKTFVDKIQEAVTSLNAKSSNLSEKLESNTKTLDWRLSKAKEDGVREIRRAQSQWEADERTVLEKMAHNKRESMEKAANDHIGPKLDKLVQENQEKLLNKREECEKKLVARRADHKAELQQDFENSLRVIRERYADDEGSSYVSRNRQVEEVKARHDSEIKALKARFAQDKRMLEESSDRTRQLDVDSHLKSMEKLKHIEQKAVEDWMVKQQREINSTLQSQAEELQAVQQEVADQYEQWLERQGTREEKMQNHRLEKRRGQLMLSAKNELETVREKLRREAEEEREQNRRKADQEIKQLRLDIQEKLESQYAADQRSSQLVSSLHTEVERLQDRLYQHRSTVTELKAVVEEERRKQRLVAVENNIDGVSFEEKQKRGKDNVRRSREGSADFTVIEQAVISMKTRLDDELARLEADSARSVAAAEATLAKTQNEKAAQDMLHYKKITSRKSELHDEFSRIEDKISALLSRKNNAIKEMRNTLQDLQTRNREFEQQLDEYRQKKIGNV